MPFLVYAITGFIDGIREAIDMVRHQQVHVAWVNFVHEQFSRETNTKATDRLSRNPRNSSMPLSAEGLSKPTALPRAERRVAARKQAKQPGALSPTSCPGRRVGCQPKAIPTIGLLRALPPIEPWNGALKAKSPPSEATS